MIKVYSIFIGIGFTLNERINFDGHGHVDDEDIKPKSNIKICSNIKKKIYVIARMRWAS